MKWAIFALIVGMSIYHYVVFPDWLVAHHMRQHGTDFHMYVEAAKGNFTYGAPYDSTQDSNTIVYIYPRWTAVLFTPATWVDFETAYVVWCVIQLIVFLFLSGKLLKITYGWIVVLALIKPYLIIQGSGNITLILAYLVLTPPGAVLAGSFKPYLFIALAFHADAFTRARARTLDALSNR